MGLFRSSEIIGIADGALEFALSAARDTHPDEYMGLLRGEAASKVGIDRDGTVLTDVLVIPGTTSNPVSATVKTSMIPNDMRAAGSIHSHPNGVLRPSDADLATFGRGKVHIIMGAPYEKDDWQAFDREGEPMDLEVLDVDSPEEEFFHFTQEDIDEQIRADEVDDESAGTGRDFWEER
ncbi:Mov34/MPN/PAD-1 family protein [Halobacteriales archaeon Cl-PHB]